MKLKKLLETKPHGYHLSHVFIYADQFCVFRTEIELKPLAEELNL